MLRTRLFLSLLPFVAILLATGLYAIVLFSHLATAVDTTVAENYRSVVGAQEMNLALSEMDRESWEKTLALDLTAPFFLARAAFLSMKDHGGGRLSIHDQARQHRAYAEAGSFGAYLFTTFGISKIKRFHRLSHEKDRPWQDVFGIGMEELEAHWINALSTSQRARGDNVPIVSKLLATNAGTACAEAQKLSGEKR